MEPENESPEPAAHDDPDVAALLRFTPVVRRNRRRDGWPAEVQRGFIVKLVECGSASKAAYAVGRTLSGAYKVRTAGGGEEFAEAWDGAVDLFLDRNPRVPRTGRWRPSDGKAPPPGEAPEPEREPDEDALWQQFQDGILLIYLRKLGSERAARLDGRIVEADFTVRQLSWLEVALDLAGLGDRVVELLKGLNRGGRHAGEIAATPVSLLLDKLRRSYWERCEEPERPPAAPLGRHDDDIATGQPLECQHWPERDGNAFGPSSKHEEHLRRNAEAQRAWEEKAKADAEEWRRRESENGRATEEEGEP